MNRYLRLSAVRMGGVNSPISQISRGVSEPCDRKMGLNAPSWNIRVYSSWYAGSFPPFTNTPSYAPRTNPPMSNVQYGIPDMLWLMPADICRRYTAQLVPMSPV